MSIEPLSLLVPAAVIALILIVAIVLVLVGRSRRQPPAALPSVPSSPTAVVCQFCKREYEPSETGRRCPGCGAATPR